MRKKHVLFFLKALGALALLAYVLAQVDLADFRQHILRLSPWMLVVAFVSFNVGQVLCAERMLFYYVAHGHAMSRRFAYISYYIGIFYNLVLPGGIGGDAYRVYLFKKVANLPVGEGIRIQLANRLNGLLVMGMMILIAAAFLPPPVPRAFYFFGLLMLGGAGVWVYLRLVKRFIREEAALAWQALPYSMAAQLCGLVCFGAIWFSLSHSDFAAYVVVFLVALIASMIPITIGGLGIREFVFLHGTEIMNHGFHTSLIAEMGVAFSLCFFAVTAATALVGLVFIIVGPRFILR